jgi:hypothetical protein
MTDTEQAAKVPRTEAGKALLNDLFTDTRIFNGQSIAERIAAIEAEAAEPSAVAVLREALDDCLSEFDKFAKSEPRHPGFLYNALDNARAVLRDTEAAARQHDAEVAERARREERERIEGMLRGLVTERGYLHVTWDRLRALLATAGDGE